MLRRSVGPRASGQGCGPKDSDAQGASAGAVVHEIAGQPVRTCLWQTFSQGKMRPRGPNDVSGRPRGPRIGDDLPRLGSAGRNVPPKGPFLAPAPPPSLPSVWNTRPMRRVRCMGVKPELIRAGGRARYPDAVRKKVACAYLSGARRLPRSWTMASLTPFSPGLAAQGRGSARCCGGNGCGAGPARTGPRRSASPRVLPRHHADPGQSGDPPGEKGSVSLSRWRCSGSGSAPRSTATAAGPSPSRCALRTRDVHFAVEMCTSHSRCALCTRDVHFAVKMCTSHSRCALCTRE